MMRKSPASTARTLSLAPTRRVLGGLGVLGILAVAGLSGCSEATNDPTGTAPAGQARSTSATDATTDAAAFTAILSRTFHANYRDASPAEVWANADLVGSGKVISVADGRITQAEDIPQNHVVIGLEPTEILGRTSGADSATVYIEIPRPVNGPVKDVADTLPIGTEFAFALRDVTDLPDGEIANAEAGRTAGSRLYRILSPATWVAEVNGQLSLVADGGRPAVNVAGDGIGPQAFLRGSTLFDAAARA